MLQEEYLSSFLEILTLLFFREVLGEEIDNYRNLSAGQQYKSHDSCCRKVAEQSENLKPYF